jgi:hypothetical protein
MRYNDPDIGAMDFLTAVMRDPSAKQSTVARGQAIRFLRTTSHHQTTSPAMTVAPARPLIHAYSGDDPMEIVDYHGRKLERWRALAEETGRLSALVELSKQVRNDSATIVARHDAREAALNSREDSLNARERQHAVHVTQFVDFVGKASVLFDKLHRLRADQAEEPLSLPPGQKSEEPEAQEDAEVSGMSPGEPSEPEPKEDQFEFPDPELPHPPEVEQPIAVGLDDGD